MSAEENIPMLAELCCFVTDSLSGHSDMSQTCDARAHVKQVCAWAVGVMAGNST